MIVGALCGCFFLSRSFITDGRKRSPVTQCDGLCHCCWPLETKLLYTYIHRTERGTGIVYGHPFEWWGNIGVHVSTDNWISVRLCAASVRPSHMLALLSLYNRFSIDTLKTHIHKHEHAMKYVRPIQSAQPMPTVRRPTSRGKRDKPTQRAQYLVYAGLSTRSLGDNCTVWRMLYDCDMSKSIRAVHDNLLLEWVCSARRMTNVEGAASMMVGLFGGRVAGL